MRKISILLSAALLLTSVNIMAQNITDSQGRRQGHWVRNDSDGSVIFEGDFLDGLETGTFVYYYHDGSVRIRNTYTIPGRVCIHEAYDEQGNLLARGSYNQRNRDGLWTFFDEQGRRVKEAEYAMGVKQGRHIVFDQKGDTAEVTTWVDNKRHGRWWKRMGKQGYITANYVSGGIEGRLSQVGDDGRLERECYYENGLKHGTNRLFEGEKLAVEERWSHGLMLDRKVLLILPEPTMVSVHEMACLAPQGRNRVVILLNDGSRLVAHESADVVYDRLGNDFFAYANHKSRVLVSPHAVQGLGKDSEGRDILLLDPQPDFAIFPDEDGIRMVQSHQYDKDSPLDKIRSDQ